MKNKTMLVGVKGKIDDGFKYAPYILNEVIVFPELKFAGYDDNGRPYFTKSNRGLCLCLCVKDYLHQ